MGKSSSSLWRWQTDILYSVQGVQKLNVTLSESWQLCAPGPAKRFRMKAIQTSKSCNIICMYTAFSATDSSSSSSSTSKGLKDPPQPLSSGGSRITLSLTVKAMWTQAKRFDIYKCFISVTPLYIFIANFSFYHWAFIYKSCVHLCIFVCFCYDHCCWYSTLDYLFCFILL